MSGIKNLEFLLKNMTPQMNEGEYVFCIIENISNFNIADCIGFFKETEGYTLILQKEKADEMGLEYSSLMAWITLTVHSSLEAVGLTAAFSNALAKENISCNVVAGFYHDHIFVEKNDAEKAIIVLKKLSNNNI